MACSVALSSPVKATSAFLLNSSYSIYKESLFYNLYKSKVVDGIKSAFISPWLSFALPIDSVNFAFPETRIVAAPGVILPTVASGIARYRLDSPRTLRYISFLRPL